LGSSRGAGKLRRSRIGERGRKEREESRVEKAEGTTFTLRGRL